MDAFVLMGTPSAVNQDGFTGYKTGGFTGQKNKGAHNISRFGRSFNGKLCHKIVVKFGVGKELVPGRCPYWTGSYGIDIDSLGRPFNGKCLGQVGNSGLTGGVSGPSAKTDNSEGGTHINDSAAPLS